MRPRSVSRVLIADSQPLFGHGVRRLLEDAGGFEVVAQVTAAGEALRLSDSLHPNLAFLDAALLTPEYEVLTQLVRDGGDPKVILWAPSGDAGALLGVLRLGARGILERTAPLSLAEKAARCVATGQYWIGREAVSDMVRWLRETRSAHAIASPNASPDAHLTPREREIVSAVAAGSSNKEIATRLSVTEDTVKHHLSSIFGKFGVATRLELAVFAIQNVRGQQSARLKPLNTSASR